MAMIGPYELRGEIGRGGMGVVYRAWDPRLRRDVAIKMLRSGSATAAQLRRFAREARAIAKVRHSAVVAIHEIGQHEGEPFIVMDLVRGETLQRRLDRDGPMPVEEALAIVTRVAHALVAAHEQGVLHRDLKPENILMTEAGEPLVTDFGLAKDLGDDPRLSDTLAGEGRPFLGTPGYAAPEQAGRDDPPSAATDVYGLGATLYALLTGRPPYVARSAMEVVAAMFAGPPEPPSRLRPGIPRAVDALCLRCLEREPSRRPASAAALARKLDRIAAVAPAPVAASAAGATRATRAAIFLTVAVVLVVVAGGFVWQLLGQRADLEARISQLERAAGGAGAAPAPADAPKVEPGPDRPEVDSPPRDDDAQRPAERAPTDALGWLDRGVALLALEQLDEALEALDEALRLDPDHPRALTTRGRARDLLGDVAGALADHGRAIELEPTLADAWANRAEAKLRVGRLRDAIPDYDRAVELDPTNASSWYNRGIARGDLGDHAGAIEDYDRAIALEPTRVQPIINRGLAKLSLRDFAGALADLDAAVAIDPTFAKGRANRGALRDMAGDLRGAREDYDAAIEHAPEYAAGWMNRGVLRRKVGDLPGALADLERAVELAPDDAAAWNLLGDARVQAGDPRGALTAFDRAVARSNGAPVHLAGRALARLELGDHAGTIDDCSTAIRADPGIAPAWYNRGLARERSGDLSGAVADYEQFLARAPEHPMAAALPARIASLRRRLEGGG